MQPAAVQRCPADSPQAAPMASGLSPLPGLGQRLQRLDCLPSWAASPVPCSSRKPRQQRLRYPTELQKQEGPASRMGWAEPRAGRGQRGGSHLRGSLRRSGRYPPHAPLPPLAPSTRQASAQACRACCSSTCSRSQTLAPPLRRCPRPPASPTARLASQAARQIRLWCKHRPLPQQRMPGTHRHLSTAAQMVSRHHRTTGRPAIVSTPPGMLDQNRDRLFWARLSRPGLGIASTAGSSMPYLTLPYAPDTAR